MTDIRPYQAGDETGIRELFKTCHARELPPDVWSWRYTGGSRPPATTVAVDSGKIVAHLSALAFDIWPQDRTASRSASGAVAPFPAGLWVDLMVAPAKRGLPLFLDLAEANLRQARETGMRMVIAFPNDRSYPILKRMLDWQTIDEIDALEASPASLESHSIPKADALEPDTLLRIDKFGAEFLKLHSQLALNRLAWEPVHDAAWLNWRYRAKPGAEYPGWFLQDSGKRLRGWIVTKIFEGPQGKIGDILEVRAEPAAEAILLEAALRHFKSRGVKTVSAWALRGTPSFERLCAWGLEPTGPRTHFAGRWTAPDEATPFPADGRKWRICKGDSDVF